VPDVRDLGTNVKPLHRGRQRRPADRSQHDRVDAADRPERDRHGRRGPSISVAPPPNAQSLTGVVPLHAEAMDDVGVLKIVWLIDGAPASVVRRAPYDFSWNTATVGLGSHTIEARAFDAAGNAASSGTIDVKYWRAENW